MSLLERVVSQWNDPSTDHRTRYHLLTELRNSVEVLSDLSGFIQQIMPLFINYMKNSSPKFTECAEQKVRNMILEILNRVPNHESMKSFVAEWMDVLVEVLTKDNEDTALIALRIFIEMHRNYRAQLEEKVQGFLDFVLKLYENLPQTVFDTFDNPVKAASYVSTPGTLSSIDSFGDSMSTTSEKPLIKSIHSFKVLTECPIIIVILFQLHRKYVSTNIQAFVDSIVKCLNIQVKSQMEAQQQGAIQGVIFVGVSPSLQNQRAIYSDLIAAQVKTLSFLAYILRSYSAALKAHQNVIPTFIIQLLQNCPPEAASTRKELLVATRHILSTDFRQAFVPHLQLLLDSKVLLGTGLTVHETLRPLAYSLLADFIHHVRMELSLPLLSTTVSAYVKNLHDPTISLSIQTMSSKLLVNLVDCIVTDTIPIDQRRPLLIRILTAFVDKFTAIRESLPFMFRQFKIPPPSGDAIEDFVDLTSDEPISLTPPVVPESSQTDCFRDLKFLFKTLVAGLKNILFGLRSCNPPATSQNASQFVNLTVRGFTAEEAELFSRLFLDGIDCFDMHAASHEKVESKPTINGLPAGLPHASISAEEKDVLDQFAHAFTVIDPAIFQDVFVSRLDVFVAKVEKNLALITIPQYFLAIAGISQNFSAVLLRFLMDNLESIGSSEGLAAQILLRLFKLVFLAVTVYPDDNELVLQPHLGELIMGSLRYAQKANEPLNYFLLLRSLFRSIGGGRYELLYKEVLPLLPVLLENLNNLLAASHQAVIRELFVELCLTVPVRLSVLLPYLSFLMQPLVIALQSSSDLVTQGLRTLELCIDNLTQDFLDPILAPVNHELMQALWKHIQPGSAAHSQTTLRILGKLGGRNRRIFKEPPLLGYNEQDTNIDILVDLELGQLMKLPLGDVVHEAKLALENPLLHQMYHEHAFHLIRSTILLILDLDEGPENLAALFTTRYSRLLSEEQQNVKRENVSPFTFQVTEEKTDIQSLVIFKGAAEEKNQHKTNRKRAAQEALLIQLMQGLFLASKYEAVSQEAIDLLKLLYRHFALIKSFELLETREVKIGLRSMSCAWIQNLDLNPLAEVLVEVMTQDEPQLNLVAENMLMLFFETTLTLLKSKEMLANLPIFFSLASRFCSFCYKREWYHKKGGCRGIKLITSKMDFGIRWMWMQEMKFIRAILFVLKDGTPDFAKGTMEEAKSTLEWVLKVCNRAEYGEESLKQDRQVYFNQLICLLISELSNGNAVVRETIQQSLQLLAESNGSEVTELLLPARDRLLNPIFAKPLRALPFSIQIGHIDAIRYCLTLRPPLLTFSEELLRLLHEALALADAEDHALVSKSNQFKNAASLTQLRVVCLQLLSNAMICEEFQDPKQTGTRNRIISVFFKSLYARSSEIVDVAKKGLALVITQHQKLPKDLLQHGLRPILMNLSDYKRLTVLGLEGLARLLELLTSYFKVEIGKKLLEHLNQWAEPSTLEEAATKALSESQEVKIMAAILNVFHLLPPTANLFMENLVIVTVKLENALRRNHSSPFRMPLLMFLQRYATEATEFFIHRLKSTPISRLYMNLLLHPKAVELRSDLIKSSEAFIEAVMALETSDGRYYAMLIVQAIVKYHPTWFSEYPDALRLLNGFWKTRDFFGVDGWTIKEAHEPMILLQIFTQTLERNPSDIELLFSLLSILDGKIVFDRAQLHRFFQKFSRNASESVAKQCLAKFITLYPDTMISTSMKAMAINWIIVPLIIVSKQLKRNIIETFWIDSIEEWIWTKQSDDDNYVVACLQLTSVLIQHVPQMLVDHRKFMAKYIFSLCNADDPTTKQSAYVAVGIFIDAFETPQKFIVSSLSYLLRSTASESRHLVKKALETIILACPKRLPDSQGNYPTWIKLVRKVVLEESHAIPPLIMIWQLILRFHHLFYPCREHFIPAIINSLARIGLTMSPSTEYRMLTIDLVELLLAWEHLQLYECGKMKASEMISSEYVKYEPANNIKTIYSHEQNPLLLEMLVNFLVRMCCPLSDSSSKHDQAVHRCANLLQEFLKLFPNVEIRVQYFEKCFPLEIGNEQSSAACDALIVMESMLKVLPKTVADSLLSQSFVKCLEKTLNCSVTRVIQLAIPLYQRCSGDSSLLMVCQQNLNAGKNLSATLNFLSVMNLHPDAFENMVPGIIRSLTLLVREYLLSLSTNITTSSAGTPSVNLSTPNLNNSATSATPVTSKIENNCPLMIIAINILRKRVNFLGDHRRTFLVCLVNLIEKCVDNDLLTELLDVTEEWVCRKGEAFPTLKEKCSLMLKWICIEQKKNLFVDIYHRYLKLVLFIYQDEQFNRTELTVRLEPAFLIGCQVNDPVLRESFLSVFDKSILPKFGSRLLYIFGVQNWEFYGSYFWIHQALELLLLSFPVQNDVGAIRDSFIGFSSHSLSLLCQDVNDDLMEIDVVDRSSNRSNNNLISNSNDNNIDLLLQNHRNQIHLFKCDMNAIIKSIRLLSQLNHSMAMKYFVAVFANGFSLLTQREQQELTGHLVPLLAKEYHLKQAVQRPNVIQVLLQAILKAGIVDLPPHLIKYLGRTFNAWHEAIELLCKACDMHSKSEDNRVYQSTLDAVADLYNDLNENDMFFGLWRRRSIYSETNVALSFEQHGLWKQAQEMYEQAQQKARSGAMPYTESEYYLWEEHWIRCAQRLQQWDLLAELAKQEGNSDLALECSWRLSDWTNEREAMTSAVKSASQLSSIKRKVYDAFLALLSLPEKANDFSKINEEGMQQALLLWHALPSVVGSSHIPLLVYFQQFVELSEAQDIYQNIAPTNLTNKQQVAQNLKGVMSTWRDRLPNTWDDIHIWSDLVAWRQHVFSSINKAFQPFAAEASGQSSSFAFRGYHEIAWIINRFAHVARKHQLVDVCVQALMKIYSLPNIEIQEAFLKLREQAKCYFQTPSELPTGLEIINHTNLGYFGNQQKAEFFALKASFLTRMGLHDEANKVFGQAVQIDMNLAKGWAAWGKFNDARFQATKDMSLGSNAINCYLQAAMIHRNSRARKYLARVLWLLSFEDSSGTLTKAFELFNSELPTWYWITFIPQLLTSLTRIEAKQAKALLVKIAKSYPQALHFPLRTVNEDYHQQQSSVKKEEKETIPETPRTPNPVENIDAGATPIMTAPLTPKPPSTSEKKLPFEHTEELIGIIKTGYPLLALSMENMVDHIIQRLRSSPDEDLYRIIVTLMYESFQQSMLRLSDQNSTSLMELSLQKVSDMLASPNHSNHRYKSAFDRDFITCRPSLDEVVSRLQQWRNKLDPMIKKVPKMLHLENFSRYLVEFEHQKYDDVEMPGQYLLQRDNNNDFVKIERFEPHIDIVRKHGTSYRRITIRGHDGSAHPFIVQNPAARHARREERIMQLFRILNGVLEKRKESRKRGLFFHVPLVVPLSTHVRIIQDDPSYVSLEDIYEDHCERIGVHPDDLVVHFRDSLMGTNRSDLLNVRLNLFDKISEQLVPDSVVTKFLTNSMPSYTDLWMLRKQFTLQYATLTFLTYVMSIGHRFPHKLSISQKTGKLMSTDLLPSLNHLGQFALSEPVPFRLTPNIQHFITDVGLEGIFTSSIMATARCLTEPEFALEDFLSIFVRDELITWYHAAQYRATNDAMDEATQENDIRNRIAQNVELVLKRTQTLACLKERETSVSSLNCPVNQTVLNLISCAVNPQKLCQMDAHWHPWL